MKTTAAKIAALLTVSLLLTACAPAEPTETTTEPTTQATTAPTTAATTQPTTAPTTAPTTEATTAPTEPTQPPYESTFTQEDIDTFTKLFSQEGEAINYYNRLMSALFATPEDVDVRSMFYDQDIDEDYPLTEKEKTFLGEQSVIELDLDVIRISADKIDAALKQHLGLGLEDIKGYGMGRLVYYEDTDCYYHCKGDSGLMMFKILGGNHLEDGIVEVYYDFYGLENRLMTLRETENGYQVISNVAEAKAMYESELDYITFLLKQQAGENGPGAVNYLNRFMFAEFESPEKADLNRIFYDQDLDEAGELTDAEKAFLGKQSAIDLNLDVVRVSREKMETVLQEYLKLSLEEMDGMGLDQFVYFEDTDCYYHSKGDSGVTAFKITGGTDLGNGYMEIYYTVLDTWSRVLTLHNASDGYTVISNLSAEK